MTRRMLLVAGMTVLAAVAFRDSAAAQFYKGKTITMIVNYPAGGPTDIEGRIVAQHLPAHIPGNPTIVVKNVGGAGGLIGSNQLGEAAPNGETIGFFTLDVLAPVPGQFVDAHALFRFRPDRRRGEPAGRLHAQGHAARHQGRDRPDEGAGVQGAVAQRAEHQHAQPGAGARSARASNTRRSPPIAA